MNTRVRREKRSRSVDGILKALRRTAAGEVVADVAAKLAPTMEKAMKGLLRPHRDTGAALARASATASGSTITIENVGYARYIKNYAFGRRLPKNWVGRIQKTLATAVRAELRRVL